jgi:cell filamentation protein
MTFNEVSDPYLDPQTGVLRNKLGITDPEALAAVEADLTFARGIWLNDHPPPGSFDLDHLRLIHRLLFGDIYDWAGELRTVLISRTEPFCLPQYLEASAEKAFAEMHDEALLRDLPRSEFVDRLAYHLGEVNALHPFREGNGRCARLLERFGEITRENGLRVRKNATRNRCENFVEQRVIVNKEQRHRALRAHFFKRHSRQFSHQCRSHFYAARRPAAKTQRPATLSCPNALPMH